MKSLIESLFDSKTQTMESLFDKNIVENKYCFGNYYKITDFWFQDDNVMYNLNNLGQIPYDDMFSHIKLSELKKKYKPTDISKIQYGTWWHRIKYNDIKTCIKPLEYIISLINNIEIAPPNTFTGDAEFVDEFARLLDNETTLYLKDRKIQFTAIRYYGRRDILVSIVDRGSHSKDFDYTMELYFKEK